MKIRIDQTDAIKRARRPMTSRTFATQNRNWFIASNTSESQRFVFHITRPFWTNDQRRLSENCRVFLDLSFHREIPAELFIFLDLRGEKFEETKKKNVKIESKKIFHMLKFLEKKNLLITSNGWQAVLWDFQWVFWQSREQYDALLQFVQMSEASLLHFSHFPKVMMEDGNCESSYFGKSWSTEMRKIEKNKE